MNLTKSAPKSAPRFFSNDYPYIVIGNEISEDGSHELGAVYDINCSKCKMSLRAQGKKINDIYKHLKMVGCLVCGNNELIIKKVDI